MRSAHIVLTAFVCSIVTLILIAPLRAQLKSAAPNAITIVRKPGQPDGEAQMIVNGKIRKISPHAVEAFLVRNGEAALVIVLQPPKTGQPKQYLLRYYDLDSGRKRVLGALPMSSAKLTETNTKEESWAFALSGLDDQSNQPVIVVGDDQAIPGLLPNAATPTLHEGKLSFTIEGTPREATLGVLLGTALSEIYSTPQQVQSSIKLLQVFPNGTAIAVTPDNAVHQTTWKTDGRMLQLLPQKELAAHSIPWSELEPVKGVPAGKRFGVRLMGELSSRTTHEGDTVKAVSITPVVVNGEILIPTGSVFEGFITQADSTGWGFKHETASMTVAWKKATLTDGRELELSMRIFQVENAQENVSTKGKIQGIRSTGTPGHSAESGVLTFAGIDPIAYIFTSASGSAVMGFAEPEILYKTGTELILENTTPLLTSQTYPPAVKPFATTSMAQLQLRSFVNKLPFRTKTKGSNKVSDLTNLVFIGSPAGLQRAFKAAGWLPTEELTAGSTFKTLKTISGNQTYTQAPMSTLLLDEREPLFALSKTTNTFASRHHLRVFPTAELFNGSPVLTSSSTQDIGIAFSKKQKTFIHVIDQHIDNERSKVVNDLIFTGCVDNLDMVERPWVPQDAYNSTGDRLLTDGNAAVLRINDCQNPRTTMGPQAPAPPRAIRITRNTTLTIRDALYRGNLVYQGIAGAFAVRRYFRSSNEMPIDNGAWRKTDASGAQYKGHGDSTVLHTRDSSDFNPSPSPYDLATIETMKESHRWDPPRYEFALQGGYLHMRTNYLSGVALIDESSDPKRDGYFLYLQDEVDDGWAAGGSVTLNSWKYFSSEFAYFRQQVKYELVELNITLPSDGPVVDEDVFLDSERIGLVTRQFEYNLLMHARPPKSRWRPYAAVGPVLQMIALNGAPLKKPAGIYNLGLKNIGLIKAAFDFGNTPPLDGGGIFHVGLQYGGGIKYRVAPRVMLRADFRETWSKSPDIIADSYEDYDPNLLDETYTTTVIKVKPDAKFLQDRYTLGVAFTF